MSPAVPRRRPSGSRPLRAQRREPEVLVAMQLAHRHPPVPATSGCHGYSQPRVKAVPDAPPAATAADSAIPGPLGQLHDPRRPGRPPVVAADSADEIVRRPGRGRAGPGPGRRQQRGDRRRRLPRHRAAAALPGPAVVAEDAGSVTVGSRPASLGRRGRRHRRGRLVRARVPVRHPRLGRRHADPERRRVRPGGRGDDRRGRGRTTGRRRRRRSRSPPDECGFAYRTSVFKHNDRYVVLSVDFWLARSRRCRRRSGTPNWPGRSASRAGDRVPLADARAAVLALRAGKGMVLDPADPDTCSVGSFFTNPVLPPSAYDELSGTAPPAWATRPPGRAPTARSR